KICALLAIEISLASTVKEDIVRKPACLRVLHNVLKRVRSPPIRAVPVWWTTALTENPCPVVGR
ncbi:jg17593, partial [Pararge aegeria aegeria]